MNMTPNDPRTEALMCKSSGIQPENREAWIIRIQALTAKEMMSKAHMQVHTNKESREKQSGRKLGTNWAQAGQPSPFWARFGTPFDLATIRTIYSPSPRATERLIHHPLPRSKEEKVRTGASEDWWMVAHGCDE
jgi:hypothetical protein